MQSIEKPIPLSIGGVPISSCGVRIYVVTPHQQNDFNVRFDWDNPDGKQVLAIAAELGLESYAIFGHGYKTSVRGKECTRQLFGHPRNPEDNAFALAVDTVSSTQLRIVAPETARVIVHYPAGAVGLFYGETEKPEFYELAGMAAELRLPNPDEHHTFIAHARLHALGKAHDCQSH